MDARKNALFEYLVTPVFHIWQLFGLKWGVDWYLKWHKVRAETRYGVRGIFDGFILAWVFSIAYDFVTGRVDKLMDEAANTVEFPLDATGMPAEAVGLIASLVASAREEEYEGYLADKTKLEAKLGRRLTDEEYEKTCTLMRNVTRLMGKSRP